VVALVVLYDACVLYPAPLRDLLVRLANTGIVRARWSEPILEECFRNILENRPDLKPEALKRTRELMTQAVADCIVTDFDDLLGGLDLPDANDRHVLAAAIRAGAQAIITFNLDDFPEDKLAPHNVAAKHPDEFVLDAIDLAPGLVTTVVSEQAASLRNPPRTVSELLDTLRDRDAPLHRGQVGAANRIHPDDGGVSCFWGGPCGACSYLGSGRWFRAHGKYRPVSEGWVDEWHVVEHDRATAFSDDPRVAVWQREVARIEANEPPPNSDNPPKRHHYVPEMYLRRFASAGAWAEAGSARRSHRRKGRYGIADRHWHSRCGRRN
jgi:hypothetical protein